MAAREVVPALGLDSFSCPHCGALAAQFWFKVLPKSFSRNEKPHVTLLSVLKGISTGSMEKTAQSHFISNMLRLEKNEVTYSTSSNTLDSAWVMVNLHLSMCHACNAFAVWVKDNLTWPNQTFLIEPHQDMPPDVRGDFIEAAFILNMSPRGASALARLAIQKLMTDLGEKGKNINDDIASLVKKGLETEIQQALDVVRVIGNNAVHPGTVDLKDDKATALALLQLVNLVVDRRISTQKRISEMFNNLPAGAREAIAKRDAPKPSKP